MRYQLSSQDEARFASAIGNEIAHALVLLRCRLDCATDEILLSTEDNLSSF